MAVNESRLDEPGLSAAVQNLIEREVVFARIVRLYGPPPLWARQPGFPTLVHIILEQQVSLASARAAFLRLGEAINPVSPQKFLILSDERLKTIGFSRQKTRYGRELANAVLDGSLDLAALETLDDVMVRAQLMAVKGIGVWTADIYLLMALGRPDIWPRGDIALQTALQRAFGLDSRPDPDTAEVLSQAWKPWRAAAARILWHFYLSGPAGRRPTGNSNKNRTNLERKRP